MKKKLCILTLHSMLWLISHWLVCLHGDDVLTATANLSSVANISAKGKKIGPKVARVDTLNKKDAKLHSSFEETNPENTLVEKVVQIETASHNIGLANEFLNNGQGVVFNVVDTATAELQQRAELPPSTPDLESVVTLDKDVVEEPTSINSSEPQPSTFRDVIDDSGKAVEEIAIEQGSYNATEENTTVTQEDIPSFSEWTQKQLEEAEKKKIQDNSSVPQSTNGKHLSGVKLRSKNYASPDCGAKIVATNPEAVSPNAVLSPSRDEYKLNACTNRIWFIVELCEAVQAKRIDLANFELFSSSPKDFTVSISDRFPSRDWSVIGQFAAKDERDIQSFDLYPHLFGKYIKVEIKSHYGSEHFCPISLFRVYGTSEFEVLEKEDQANAVSDDDDDETLDSGDNETSKNLLSSATDAVISIVKKAAEVLGNKGNTSNQANEHFNNTKVKNDTLLVSSCSTPIHYVVCDNCTEILFGNIYELMSCRHLQLMRILNIPFIKESLINSGVCSQFGLKVPIKKPDTTNKLEVANYLPLKYVGALCNTIAITKNQMSINITGIEAHKLENSTYINISTITNFDQLDQMIRVNSVTSYQVENEPSVKPVEISDDVKDSGKDATLGIKPTKTLPLSESETDGAELVQSELEVESCFTHPTDSIATSEINGVDEGKSVFPNETRKVDNGTDESISDLENVSEFVADEQLDMSEMNVDSGHSSSQPTTSVGVQVQKESVFLRLSSRIKALERNMSLSTQYLEELSRRYKKQVEEIQRLLDKTVATLTIESKKKEEKNERLEEQIKELKLVVESLVAEKSKWNSFIYWSFLIGVILFCFLVRCYKTNPKQTVIPEKVKHTQRRKSIDIVSHNRKPKKKRRPSEEALRVRGTYEHLLIVEPKNENTCDNRKYILRKRKKSVFRSNSVTTLFEDSEKSVQNELQCNQFSSPDCKINHTGNSSGLDWVESNHKCRIQEPPLPLEESEHTFLENLNYNEENVDIDRSDVLLGTQSASAYFNTVNKSSHNGQVASKNKKEHKKSASVDETLNMRYASTVNGDTLSFGGSFESPRASSKKEKKGGLKRILKKVF